MSLIRLLGCWLTMGGLGWLAVSATLAEDGTAKRSVIPFKILKTGHMLSLIHISEPTRPY